MNDWIEAGFRLKASCWYMFFQSGSGGDAFEASLSSWFMVNSVCVYVEGVESGGSAVCIWGTFLCTELSVRR